MNEYIPRECWPSTIIERKLKISRKIRADEKAAFQTFYKNNKMLISYVFVGVYCRCGKFLGRERAGCIIAVKTPQGVKYSWSVCSNVDKFDKYYGLNLAIANINNEFNEDCLPFRLEGAMGRMVDRATRYFRLREVPAKPHDNKIYVLGGESDYSKDFMAKAYRYDFHKYRNCK